MGSIQTQMLFKKLRDQYRAIGKGNVMLTQSSLVLVQDLDAARTNYTFDILNNEGNPKSYEIRLSQQDAFHLTSMQLLISDAGASPDDPEVDLLTYPNQVTLGAAFADWRNIYKGKFDFTIDNVKVIQDLSAEFGYYIPETQGIVVGAGNAVDQVRMVSDSKHDFAPSINLSGAKKNEIKLTMPGAVAGAAANQIIYLQLNGIVAIGGAAFQM